MATTIAPRHLLLTMPAYLLALLLLLLPAISLCADGQPEAAALPHHGGRLLSGNLNVGILWYGAVTRAQRKAILSFFRSLNSNAPGPANQPQVSAWWSVVESYQTMARAGAGDIRVKVVNQVVDPNYSLGKVLITDFIKRLIPKATGGNANTLALIVASKGVTVQDMCAGSCAQHGLVENQPYVAVGDPEEECPECAWPFLGARAVKPPSGNVGADAMVRLLAGGLAGAVTNPFGDGFFTYARGERLIEATTNCPAILSNGNLPSNPVNGGAYNAVGDQGTKFLLPAIWNPKTSSCWTPL